MPALPFNEYPLAPRVDDARALLGQRFPALSRVLLHPGIRSLSANLKFLDLLARRVASGAIIDPTAWVGESSVAEWFWTAEVERGAKRLSRGSVARRLAERQGDALLAAVPIDELDAPALDALETLIGDRICQRVSGDRVAFAHDLYGDWIRLRILLNHNREDLAHLAEQRRDSPLWHRALRLLGIHALEHSSGLTDWRELLRTFSGGGPNALHDLLLEAPVFAANPRPLLDAICSDLLSDDGLLLRRLLSRFLMFATVPDQRMVAIGIAVGMDENAARATYRRPYWPYWLDVLAFLHANRGQIVQYAPEQVSQIAEMWLKFSSKNIPGREDAAGIAVALGKFALDSRKGYGPKARRETRKRCFTCLFAAAGELPDLVIDVALVAAERWIGPDLPPPLPDPEIVARGLGPLFPPGPVPLPWPDGPRASVDEDIQSAVLDDNAIIPLFCERPTVARELILACLIMPPRAEHWGSDPLGDRELCLVRRHKWHPAIFFNGPFLACLKADFDEGLKLIKDVVDFATERSLERENRRLNAARTRALQDGVAEEEIDAEIRVHAPRDLKLGIGSDVLWARGGEDVYGWSAGLGVAPSAVANALMALEQYLYLELDRGFDLTAKVQAILTPRISTAFLGLLCDVGRKARVLFEGPLRPLLSTPELYLWEISKVIHGRSHHLIGAHERGEVFLNAASEFHGLEHRKEDLRFIAIQLMLKDSAMREYFAAIREDWSSISDDDERRAAMRAQLAAALDPASYEWRVDAEHGHVLVNVRAVEEQKANESERLLREARMLRLSFPMKCREILDGRKQLTDSELGALWDEWKSVTQLGEQSDSASEGDSYSGPFGNQHAVAVAAGVAMFSSQDWTYASDERLALVHDRAKSLMAVPEVPSRFDFNETVSAWSWDAFFLEAIALIFSRDPADSEWRRAVAHGAMWPRYGSQKLFFSRMFENRSGFRADFSSLRRLAIASAHLRVRTEFLELVILNSKDVSEDIIARIRASIERWLEEQVESFVAGTIAGMPVSWSQCYDTERFDELEAVYRLRNHRRDIDLKMVVSSHGWSPLPSRAIDAEEGSEWVIFWSEALASCVRRLELAQEKDAHFYPDDEERWVLSHIAALVLELPEQDAAVHWKPILALPRHAHDWPEVFMRTMHRLALTASAPPLRYTGLVRSLATYALADTKRQRWSIYDETWNVLLGIDGSTCDLWELRHGILVGELADVHALWWGAAPKDLRRIAVYARWLKGAAARALRLRSLRWFAASISEIKDSRNDDRKECESALAALLDCVWSEQEQLLRRDAQSFDSFRLLLAWLVDQQCPLGLELSERLGRLG